MTERITIRESDIVKEFYNNVDFCVGTGRMGLALHEEYMNELRLVQKEIGFRHIRGHGLFCDDMAIYQHREDEEGNKILEYNFTYLDRVIDSYLDAGIRPFLELGFMPSELASGEQTVFYWKGNVTPPKEYSGWCALVRELLEHLIIRYGGDEVTAWPVEVWNEPNLPGFWKDADMQEYFKLFRETFYAVKAVDSRFRVGGPAVCGGTDEVWIKAFLDFCDENEIDIDFITRHHYTCGIVERKGHYAYPHADAPEVGRSNLATTRAIADGYDRFRGKEIHITEFNTSWYPRNVIHDTNFNAAYIAHQLSWLGDLNESYSYWTFGDVFEETGVPFSMFHGGFGMIANGCVEKPTFWTFKFFKQLKNKGIECAYRSENAIVMRKSGGGYCGAAWNFSMEGAADELSLELCLDADNGEYSLITYTVDPVLCNPLKAWHDIGEPKTPDKEQLAIIKAAAKPLLQTSRLSAESGKLYSGIAVRDCGVVYFEISPSTLVSDRGYDYERVIQII